MHDRVCPPQADAFLVRVALPARGVDRSPVRVRRRPRPPAVRAARPAIGSGVATGRAAGRRWPIGRRCRSASRGGCRASSSSGSWRRASTRKAGPLIVAGQLGLPASTVWKVLRRHGVSRLRRPARDPVVRYERERPGELVHVDIKKLGRFWTVGKRDPRRRLQPQPPRRLAVPAPRDRRPLPPRLRRAACPSESPADCVAFLRRAVAWYRERGITVERVLTDNGNGYRSHAWATACAELGIAPPLHPPPPPADQRQGRSAGQDPAPRVGLPLRLPHQRHRARALPGYLRWYNQHRPHSSLGGRPPISRVSQVRGSHI